MGEDTYLMEMHSVVSINGKSSNRGSYINVISVFDKGNSSGDITSSRGWLQKAGSNFLSKYYIQT